ncbi:MAG: glycosyl transferase family 1, partial [Bacteroidota bacterium]
MKKIVIAHLYNNYTGSPKVLADVIQALNESDYQLHLHTNKGPGFLDEVLVDEKFYAWYTWHPNKYLRLINFMISQLLLFFSLLRYWGQDVIIYANTILPFGAGLAGWIMRKKVIYHV